VANTSHIGELPRHARMVARDWNADVRAAHVGV